MDKAMEAKVDEFMKEYGRRELSMEDMDKVSGGSFTYRMISIASGLLN